MGDETTSRERIEIRLREKAAQAGIAIPDERVPDIVDGACRLQAAAGHVRRFLSDPPERP